MHKVVRALAIAAASTIVSCDDDGPLPPDSRPKPSITLTPAEASVVMSDAIGRGYLLDVPITYSVARNGVEGSLSVSAAASFLYSGATAIIATSEDTSTGSFTVRLPLGVPARSWFVGNLSVAAASTNGASPIVFFGGSPPDGARVTWSLRRSGFFSVGLPFPSDR